MSREQALRGDLIDMNDDNNGLSFRDMALYFTCAVVLLALVTVACNAASHLVTHL